MALTPLSTPLTTEYKPLGLESFALPLSKLQEKFDLTAKELDATNYALNHLSADDERTKKLLGDLNSTTADLSESLVRTGNFREVGSKLRQLNEFYNKNPELAAIKGNYDSYKTSWAEMDQLRKDEKITVEQLKRWEYWAKNNFKGTNYNKETGSYNSGKFDVTGPDLRQEMSDKAQKAAGMTKDDGTFDLLRLGELGVTGEEAANLAKLKTKGKSKEQLAKEIYGVLSLQPKYLEYLKKEAEIDFFYSNDNTKKAAIYSGEDPLSFAKGQLEKSKPTLLARQQLELARAANSTSEKEEEYYKNQAARIQEEIESIDFALTGSNPEFTEDLAETYFTVDKLGYLEDISMATADLVDSIQEDITGFGGQSGVSKEKQTKIDEIGNVVYSIDTVKPGATSGEKENYAKMEGAESTYIQEANKDVFGEDVNIPSLLKENEQMKKNSLATETYQTIINKYTGEKLGEIKVEDSYKYETLPDIFKNGADIKAVDYFTTKYDERIEDLQGEIVDLNTQLSQVSPGSAEYREIASKIVNLNNDKNQNILAKTKQLKDLDFTINELFTSLNNAGLGTKEFSFEKLRSSLEKMSQLTGSAQFKGFATELKERYATNPDRAETELKEIATLWNENKSNSLGFLKSVQNISDLNIEYEIAPTGEATPVIGVDSSDPGSLIIRSIFDQFKTSKTLGSEGYVQIPKVNVTEGLDKFTNNMMTDINEAIADFPTDFPQVKWNPVTREATPVNPGTLDLEGQTSENPIYDINVYADNPSIIGTDTKGNLILKYEKKPKYRISNSGTLKYFADLSSGLATSDKEKDDDYKPRFGKEDVSAFESANPDQLYVSIRKTNFDPVLEAEENYVDLTVAGLNAGNSSKGINIIEQQRNNFAPLWLVDNVDRTKDYFEMSKTLVERAQKGIKSSDTFQGPAYTQDNGDGSFTDFSITYKTTTDNKIIAQPVRTTRIPSNKSNTQDQIIEEIELPSVNITLGNNLPLALLKMDMTFGTGNERDLITTRRDGYDVPFVIAFENQSLYIDPSTNQEALNNIAN